MHNAGVSVALQPALLSGATLVLAPSADVWVVLDLIESTRPKAFRSFRRPSQSGCSTKRAAAMSDLSSVKDFVVGGQKLPVDIAKRLRDELSIAIRQKFGMAEGCSP